MHGGESAGAVPVFAVACDVPQAGVLVALPALLANGLFHQVDEHFTAPGGYYRMPQIILLMAFLILARVLSLEQIRNQPCGEWGRILGLDRIPEVKTLRAKLAAMVTAEGMAAWARSLSQFWMEADPGMAGILYVDGHVRAYHGDQTRLPERFSSRDRLCVRSLMDYWTCDRDGKPFFVVTAVGTEGLIHHLRTTIIPQLLQDVPHQPTAEALAANPDLHRFIVVFDREGYSPDLFAELWTTHRIAAMTYRKGDYEAWDHARFARHTVNLPYGNDVDMDLAEATSCDHKIAGVTLREIRRLSDNLQHQTAIITTCRSIPMVAMAGHMFARWSQENFLNYATRDLAIDRLAGYQTAAAPDDAQVRNPAWRVHDQQARRLRAERAALIAERGRIALITTKTTDVGNYLVNIATIAQSLKSCQEKLDAANTAMRTTPRRIALKDCFGRLEFGLHRDIISHTEPV
jgi:prepilin-type processing-associated H-X9-DG protein